MTTKADRALFHTTRNIRFIIPPPKAIEISLENSQWLVWSLIDIMPKFAIWHGIQNNYPLKI